MPRSDKVLERYKVSFACGHLTRVLILQFGWVFDLSSLGSKFQPCLTCSPNKARNGDKGHVTPGGVVWRNGKGASHKEAPSPCRSDLILDLKLNSPLLIGALLQ